MPFGKIKKRVLARWTANAVCVILAMSFVVMHAPWAIRVFLIKAFETPIVGPNAPLPPASARYYVRVENRSTEELMATVSHVNDVTFQARDAYEEYIASKQGWKRYTERVLAPQESWLANLPSEEDPRTGFILVCLRTEPDSYGRQRIALYLMPWEAARYQGPGPDNNPLYPSLVIQDKDLVELVPSEPHTTPIRIPVRESSGSSM